MDDRHRTPTGGTAVQNPAYRSPRWRPPTDRPRPAPGRPARRASVLVGPEDPRRGAGVADRQRALQVAQGHRQGAVREEAVHVVGPLAAPVDGRDAAERAALDPRGREERLRDRARRSARRGPWARASSCECGTSSAAQPSTGCQRCARRRRYCPARAVRPAATRLPRARPVRQGGRRVLPGVPARSPRDSH